MSREVFFTMQADIRVCTVYTHTRAFQDDIVPFIGIGTTASSLCSNDFPILRWFDKCDAIWHIINFLGDLWPGREVICRFFDFEICMHWMFGALHFRWTFVLACTFSPPISSHFINISCIFVWVNTARRTFHFFLLRNKFVYAFHDNDHSST